MLGIDKFAEPFYFSNTLSRFKWVICKYLGSMLYGLLLFINNNKKKVCAVLQNKNKSN